MALRRVLIVGGGSAGWITAAYLNGALNDRSRAPRVEITLLESPDVPRISVGEATIPSILHVLEVAGVDEREFMKRTDATFKQAIKYPRWARRDGGFYYHPFTRAPFGPIDRSGDAWAMSDRRIPYMDTVTAQPAICEMNLAPKMYGQWALGSPLHYAFHMNAEKFADYLQEFSTERGVKHVRAHMTDVEMKNEDQIAAVETDRAGRIEADVFVDCTGFNALLLGKRLGVGYRDMSRFLLCDRALVMPIPYDVAYPGEMRPYTTATALSAGWIWDIPLRSRRAIGYVHSSQFIDLAKAEEELRAYEGPHVDELSTRVVNFHVGWRKKHWRGNCIANGLAGGFIEPLESTGLYLSELGAVMLAEHFPFKDEHIPALAFRYNRILSNRYYEILDFINLHYCLTQRADSDFWREVQRPERITDRLKAKLDFWRVKAPSQADLEDQFFITQSQEMAPPEDEIEDRRPPVDTAKLWSHYSYESIMYGMGVVPREFPDDLSEPRPPAVIPERIKTRIAAAKLKLPRHEEYLKRFFDMPDYPVGPRPAGWTC